jgi:hypothetical protein
MGKTDWERIQHSGHSAHSEHKMHSVALIVFASYSEGPWFNCRVRKSIILKWFMLMTWWFHCVIQVDGMMIPLSDSCWWHDDYIVWFMLMSWWLHCVVHVDDMMIPLSDSCWWHDDYIVWFMLMTWWLHCVVHVDGMIIPLSDLCWWHDDYIVWFKLMTWWLLCVFHVDDIMIPLSDSCWWHDDYIVWFMLMTWLHCVIHPLWMCKRSTDISVCYVDMSDSAEQNQHWEVSTPSAVGYMTMFVISGQWALSWFWVEHLWGRSRKTALHGTSKSFLTQIGDQQCSLFAPKRIRRGHYMYQQS